MEHITNIISLIFDPFAIVILAYILFNTTTGNVPRLTRFALAFAVAGLAGEVAWSAYKLLYGHYPLDNHIPWWIGKDMGYFLIACSFLKDRNLLSVHSA